MSYDLSSFSEEEMNDADSGEMNTSLDELQLSYSQISSIPLSEVSLSSETN
jgi:hypothetical protein